MKNRVKLVLKTIISIAVMILILAYDSVESQEINKFAEKGITEIGGAISFQRLTPVFDGKTGETTTIFSLAPYAGFFICDGFEMGLNPLELVIISRSGTNTIQTMIFAAPAYHFKVGTKTYPFIEALIGYALKSSDGYSNHGFSWGARSGVKLALIDRGLLNLSVQYLNVTMNPKKAANRNGFNQLLLSAGWTVWF
jgi:hypothetical protein